MRAGPGASCQGYLCIATWRGLSPISAESTRVNRRGSAESYPTVLCLKIRPCIQQLQCCQEELEGGRRRRRIETYQPDAGDAAGVDGAGVEEETEAARRGEEGSVPVEWGDLEKVALDLS